MAKWQSVKVSKVSKVSCKFLRRATQRHSDTKKIDKGRWLDVRKTEG